ncbi:MAG: LysR family transcriptional regulator [Pseudomonadota bacterium]
MDTANHGGSSEFAPGNLPGVMFEMLRSFTTLASTLNLSHAVAILGSTRQTVRRHIQQLEEMRGEPLFEVHDRQYVLTEAGVRSVREAENILDRTLSWIAGHKDTVGGLARVIYEAEGARPFYAQQHPIMQVWVSGQPLIQEALRAWVRSEGQIEHEAMDLVSPYLIVYRKFRDDWLCVRIGEQSNYATWLGWRWARSAIGSPLHQDSMRSPSDQFVTEAYDSALQGGTVRFDHVATYVPKTDVGAPEPISYQRLLMGCKFPDSQPALVAAIARTRDILIEGIEPVKLPVTANDDLMNIDLSPDAGL